MTDADTQAAGTALVWSGIEPAPTPKYFAALEQARQVFLKEFHAVAVAARTDAQRDCVREYAGETVRALRQIETAWGGRAP